MTNDQQQRIEAYLNQEMSAAEKKAFEAELQADPDLQTELRRFRLVEKAITAMGRDRIRFIAEKEKQETPPLEIPRISLLNKVRFFFYSRLNTALFFLGLLILLTLLWIGINILYCPMTNLRGNYYIKPDPIHQVAGNDQRILNFFQTASIFYNNNQTDSLKHLAIIDTTGIASFYLGHLYFEEGRSAPAEDALTIALANRNNLERHKDFQDMGILKYNLLLSQIDQNRERQQALLQLEALLEDPDLKGALVRTKAAQLKKDLQSPLLQRLCFR